MGSRGSVIPFFLSLPPNKPIPITDKRMTRFMINLDEAVELVWTAFKDAQGGEIYVKKIPSMGILDIARAISGNSDHEIVGIRPGEKLHEQMIGFEDSPFTFEYQNHYKILPSIDSIHEDPSRIKDGVRVPDGFIYSSDNNSEWMSVEELEKWVNSNKELIGKI